MIQNYTPLPMDSYGRLMADLMDERKFIAVSTGFQTFFGRPETLSKTVFSPDSEVIDIDIIRGDETLAALIQRGTATRSINLQTKTKEEQYSSFSRVYPLIEVIGIITSNQLGKRVAGENPYEALTRTDRARIFALNHHTEAARKSIRTFEYLASQSILTGKMEALIGTTNESLIYDFKRNPENTYTPTTKWDASSATIMADIDRMCKIIRKNGKIEPNIALFGGGAFGAFINDDKIWKLGDNRRFEFIEINFSNQLPDKFTKFKEAGFIPRGRLQTAEGFQLYIFTYIDGYTDNAGDYINYMPTDQVLIGSVDARCDRYFGPPDTFPLTNQDLMWYQERFGFSPTLPPMPPNIKSSSATILPAMFYCDAYPSDDRKKVALRTQSALIFVTTQTDTFATLIDVLTPPAPVSVSTKKKD